MKATKTLPAGYTRVYSMDLLKNVPFAIALNIIVVVMWLVWGISFARLSMRLRPELWAGGVSLGMLEVNSLIGALVVMTVLHEGVHGVLFWLYTKEVPKFGVKLMYAYAAAPEWYLPRNEFMLVGAGPLIFLTLLGVALMPVLPLGLLPGLIFFLTFNAAGAIGDVFTILVLFQHPKDVLVNDQGERFSVYSPQKEQ